jgi:hypothetical protein
MGFAADRGEGGKSVSFFSFWRTSHAMKSLPIFSS